MKRVIKQKPNAMAKWSGLDAIDLAVFPSAKQSVYVGKEMDGLTWITGLNENSPEVLQIIDEKVRKERKDAIIKKRQELEVKTGLDLGPHSSFWRTLEIVLAEPLKQQLVLQTEEPLDEIKLHVLLANRFVAPSYEESFGEKYMNCIYFVEDEERENTRKFRKQELTDEAASVIFQLRANHEKLYYILKALGITCTETMTTHGLYMLLAGHKNSLKTVEDYEKFLEIFKMDNNTLVARTIVLEAIKRKIIKQSEGFLIWGGTRWGTNMEEVIRSFADNSESLMALKQDLIS